MIVLPEEIQHLILKTLTLNDLLNCRLTSKTLKKHVDAVLSRVKHIRVKRSDADDNFASLTSAFLFDKNVPSVLVNHREWLIDELLKFLADHCSDIRFIDAYDHAASFPALKLLSPKLIYFSLDRLKKGEEDKHSAESIANHFPHLQGYDIQDDRSIYSRPYFCANQLMESYQNRPSNDLIQMTICGEPCNYREENSTCKSRQITDEELKSIKAINILDGGAFEPQKHSPQILRSLESVQADGVCLDLSLPLPPLPNLLYFNLNRKCDNLEEIVSFLMQSPELRIVRIIAEIDKENAHAIQNLIMNCESLRTLIIHSYGGSDEEDNEYENYFDYFQGGLHAEIFEDEDEHEDGEQIFLPISSNFKDLRLSSLIRVALTDAHSDRLRTLKLQAPLQEFTFNLANLIAFSLHTPRCKETIGWLLRHLRHSTALERLVIDQYNATRELTNQENLPETSVYVTKILKVDAGCLEELANLFAVTKSIRHVIIKARGVFTTDGSLASCPRVLLDLSSLERLITFEFKIEDYPVKFKLPRSFESSQYLRLEKEWKSHKVVTFGGSLINCRVAIGPEGLPFEQLDHFNGEIKIDGMSNDDRANLLRVMHQMIFSCPKLSRILLSFVDCPGSDMQSVLDSLLERTDVKDISIKCKCKGPFPECFAQGLRKHCDRLQSVERFSLTVTCDELDEESRDVVNSLTRTHLIHSVECEIADGKYELDESKSLVFKDKATLEKEQMEIFNNIEKDYHSCAKRMNSDSFKNLIACLFDD